MDWLQSREPHEKSVVGSRLFRCDVDQSSHESLVV